MRNAFFFVLMLTLFAGATAAQVPNGNIYVVAEKTFRDGRAALFVTIHG